jgi:hypothetical protein
MKREYDFRGGARGSVRRATLGKTRITIRLDDDVLQWFRDRVHAAGGGNYQTLINEALRWYMDQAEEPAEDLLRRVIREELERRERR